MKIRHYTAIVFFLILPQFVSTQTLYDFSQESLIGRLKADIYTLASEEMEGRESGTEAEVLAADYIQSKMQEAGLSPLFDTTYIQTFTFSGGRDLGPNNYFLIKDKKFELNKDYWVLSQSGNAQLKARAVYVGFGLNTDKHNDYKNLKDLVGKVFIMEYYLPADLDTPGSRLPFDMISKKIETAVSRGSAGIVFVNTKSTRNNPTSRLRGGPESVSIPVLFAQKEVLEFWQQKGKNSWVGLSTELQRSFGTSMNVAGYWNNNADRTVIIGGHFDHLGFGGPGSRNPELREIHYGADDNASGVAGFLEAARYLTQSDLTSSNYLFIAFGAEEKGLLGSRHFTESDAYDLSKVNYMFNFDMIGRVENKRLTMIGTGTSPVWESTIDSFQTEHLDIQKSPGGTGGSDHTNFYLKNIPVLFFFSGVHADYHTPGDTPDKINYEGMTHVLSLAYYLIEQFEGQEKLAFTETRSVSSDRSRREGITLGLMPDHAYNGEGLRVQAVMDNQRAQKAGMLNGDIITRIGEEQITDINDYMKVLSSLQPNQKIVVTVLRDTKPVELNVEL